MAGRGASITISDPWDFGSACGVGPFHGRIADAGPQKLLIILDTPIQYSNENYSSATCQVRHAGVSTHDLAAGDPVSFNIVLLPTQTDTLDHITDEQFRKGMAAVGTVQLS